MSCLGRTVSGIGPGQSPKRLRWRVQPDDKANSFMELWLPKQATEKSQPEIAIRITTPTNQRSPWIGANQNWQWRISGQLRFSRKYYTAVGERSQIFLAMAPTADLAMPSLTAPSGTWLIELKNKGAATTVDVWVQRGDTPFGYPLSGRQSRLEDENYVRFDLAGRLEQDDKGSSPVRRESTINALATGTHAIVVGAYLRSDKAVSEYSGAGGREIADGASPIRSPDVSAVGDESPVHEESACRRYAQRISVVTMNGTSVAAPQGDTIDLGIDDLAACLRIVRTATAHRENRRHKGARSRLTIGCTDRGWPAGSVRTSKQTLILDRCGAQGTSRCRKRSQRDQRAVRRPYV